MRQIDEIRENRRGHQDQIKHRGDRTRLVHSAAERLPAQSPPRGGKQQRENRRSGGRLVDGEHAAVDSDENAEQQRE